jgi:glutamate-1-semialdehyde 2,1-aminomutase
MYQAGTLSGNPLAMAAGIATLEQLRDGEAYAALELAGRRLATGLAGAAEQAGVGVCVQRVGSMITVFFSDRPVTCFNEARACDTEAFATFFRTMLDLGVVLPPSQFETWFVSTAHDDDAIEHTLAAAGKAFEAVAASR